MLITEDLTINKIIPSNIVGLKWKPSIAPSYNDDHDSILLTFKHIKPFSYEFSLDDLDLIKEYFLKIKNKCKCIVEIGVCRKDYKQTSTSIFIENKLLETIYIGVDLNDKSFLNNKDKNVFTIQTDSRNRQVVYDFMKSKNIDKIDFLFIDGHHSVNMCINDWQYTEKLSDNGIIGFHDTNRHPGPYVIWDAIDENIYKKYRYFEDKDDSWGLAFVIKKYEKI